MDIPFLAISGGVNTPTFYFLVIQDDFGLLNRTGNITVARRMRTWEMYILYVNIRDMGTPDITLRVRNHQCKL